MYHVYFFKYYNKRGVTVKHRIIYFHCCLFYCLTHIFLNISNQNNRTKFCRTIWKIQHILKIFTPKLNDIYRKKGC